MNTDPIPAITIPVAVNALAVTPILLRRPLLGLVPYRHLFRKLPSTLKHRPVFDAMQH